jgi:quercetin dioxygenase-like cupin family protein
MSQKLLYPSWKEIVAFSSSGPVPQMLLETDILVVVLVGMEADQKIAPHSAPAIVFHILEGNGWMIINDNRLAVSPGATVIVPDGGTRAVEAETRMVFLGAQAGKM